MYKVLKPLDSFHRPYDVLKACLSSYLFSTYKYFTAIFIIPHAEKNWKMVFFTIKGVFQNHVKCFGWNMRLVNVPVIKFGPRCDIRDDMCVIYMKHNIGSLTPKTFKIIFRVFNTNKINYNLWLIWMNLFLKSFTC